MKNPLRLCYDQMEITVLSAIALCLIHFKVNSEGSMETIITFFSLIVTVWLSHK